MQVELLLSLHAIRAHILNYTAMAITVNMHNKHSLVTAVVVHWQSVVLLSDLNIVLAKRRTFKAKRRTEGRSI